MTVNKQLLVVMNGTVIGDVESPPNRRLRMRYHPGYAISERFVPLSASMPARPLRHGSKVIEPWLEGLLPDRPELLRQWRRAFGIRDEQVFSLLRACRCGRCRRGSVRTLSSAWTRHWRSADSNRSPTRRLPTNYGGQRRTFRSWTLTPTRESSASPALRRRSHSTRMARGWADPSGRIPTTHILKPAVPGMQDQDLVELVTMRLAQAVGLRVAESSVAVFAERESLRHAALRPGAHPHRWRRAMACGSIRKTCAKRWPSPPPASTRFRADPAQRRSPA